MNKNLQKVEIFVSSPGDTGAERKIITQIVNDLNQLQSIKKHFHLRALTYEMEAPSAVGDTPQRIIDRYMTQPKDADIFICVFWSRMGTPLTDPETKIEYQSGTHYEFIQAYEANQHHARPIILLYRCMRPIPPSQDLDQAMRVQKFFKDFEGSEARYKGLYKPYESIDEFTQIVRQDLDKVLSEFISPSESNGVIKEDGRAEGVNLQKYLSIVVEQSKQVPYHLNLPRSLEHVDYHKLAIPPHLIYPQKLPPQFSSISELMPNAGETRRRFDVDEFLKQGDRQLLVGELGSGKTMLVKQICQTLSTRYKKSDSDRIPVYISGMEISLYLDSHSETISSTTESPYLLYCAHLMEVSGNRDLSLKFWQSLFKDHLVLLLVDGIDEITNRSSRIYFIDALTQLQQRYPGMQTLVTLRPSAYSEDTFGSEYLYSCLLPFDDSQKEELIKKLRAMFDDQELLMNSSQFELTGLQSMDRLGFPLCLSVIALMRFNAVTNIQLLKTQIHERILGLILNDWNMVKFRNARIQVGFLGGAKDDTVEPSDIELLEFIAWLFYRQEVEEIDRDALTTWFMSLDDKLVQRQAEQLVKARIEVLRERTDLLSISRYNRVRFRESKDALFFASSRFSRNVKTWRDLLPFLSEVQKHNVLFSTVYNLIALRDHVTAHDFLVFILDSIVKISGYQSRADVTLYLSECFLKSAEYLIDLKEKVVQSILGILEDKSQSVDLTTRVKLGKSLGLIGDPRIGSNLVLIPKGEFFMGYDMFPEDRPAQRVLVDDFYIDKYPVTNAQFWSFIQDNGYLVQEYWTEEGWNWIRENNRQHPKYWTDERFNFPNFPVVGVSWYEADAYAKWAGKRLPTEKEWEKAARGSERDSKTKRLIGPSWAWGNEFRSDYLNCAEGPNPVNGTTPVGIYPAGASPYGIFDMCGNVSEWTADWYKPYENNNYEDSHFGEKYRVRRGGGWGMDQDFVRCTCRIGSLPSSDFAVIGFRCCVTMRP